jgi:hypothetical protein
VPILLLHGSDDTVIPPTELLWLQHNIPKQQLVATLVSPTITHVDLESKATWRERLALVHWMALMMREARAMQAGDVEWLPAGMWLSSYAQVQSW